MEGYGWWREYNVWHGSMYLGYGNDCARETPRVREYACPDVCVHASALSRSHPFFLQVSCSEAAVHSCLSDCVVVQSWLITLIVC